MHRRVNTNFVSTAVRRVTALWFLQAVFTRIRAQLRTPAQELGQQNRPRDRGDWSEENWILQITAENKQERLFSRRGLRLQRTSDNSCYFWTCKFCEDMGID